MILKTYSELKTKIENDLDLIDEDFVSETELLGYMNEALKDAESIIHTIGLDSYYFKTNDTLTLVAGTSDYDMPSDLFANKLLGVYYVNGSKKYRVDRVRTQEDVVLVDRTGMDYMYDIFNTTNGIKMRFYPTPVESGAYIQRYYIRDARQMTTSTSASNTCEIPECTSFLIQHVKCRVYEKEGNPNIGKAMADLKTLYDLMVQTLQEMVPDGNNEISPDFRFYNDMNLNVDIF